MAVKHVIPTIIENSAKEYAEYPAVRWAVKKDIIDRTYAELDETRLKVANALLARGFREEQIALVGLTCFEWIASYIGIVSTKLTAVPLDVMLPPEELVDLINRSDSTAFIVHPKLAALIPVVQENCPKVRLVILMDEALSEEKKEDVITFGDLMAEASADPMSPEDTPEEDDVCTFIFTSGTTGKSKGVMLTQRNLYDNTDNIVITTEPGSVMLSVLPIHHAFCLAMDWLMGFSKGATLAINDSLIHMVRNMARFEPKIILMVPLMIETIYKRLEAAATDPAIPKTAIGKKVFGANLTRIFSGGAHLDPFYIDAMKEYGVDIFEGYGMSECSPVISSNGEAGNKPGSVGVPLDNAKIRIVDGEVQVQGSSVMKGYYQMPKETEETIGDGWLHTGDLGYVDEDGFLFITGRLKNLIILSNGENVSPEEVEIKLALAPLVGEVVVEGQENGNGLLARIYPDPDVVEAKGLSAEEIQSQLQAVLDEYNKTQPTYRAITELVVRKYPFIKSTTKKIKRPQAAIDEPPEE